MRKASFACVVALGAFWSFPAAAVTSSRSVPSSFGANGHNISFDGRLLLARDGSGWAAQLVRPEAATFLEDGLPDASGPMLSPRITIFGNPDVMENALAICEPDPSQTPYACDEGGSPNAAGPYDCYDVWLLDSDAVTPPAQGGFIMRRRQLKLWVSAPKTPDAQVYKWEFGGTETLSPALLGIEPTVTRDGKLLIYQGHPQNDGTIDILMYTVASSACAASGWSAPKPISSMYEDPAVIGVYPLAERKLRAADGTPFEAGELFRGAYPWVFPDGEAIIFAAAPMPCIAPENPPGCGPRRNALSVVGYPTNWGVAHIDGGANPSTTDTVRLFFSSPGPDTFSQIPVSAGVDVWPFFGSNTSNYVELVFDDGLDGGYGGFWHLNESVSHAGELDPTKSPDVSGYFNTLTLEGGIGFAAQNDGVVGKSLAFDGVDDRVVAANAASLNPANGITIEAWIMPQSPDCDGANNWRLLLGKGNIIDGSYTLVMEENLAIQARVNVAGEQHGFASPSLPADQWTHVAFEYDGPTGRAGFWFGGQPVGETTLPTGTITETSEPLTIGAPGPRAACPDGDGAFAGRLDEVAVSRYSRHWGEPPEPVGTGGGEPAGATTGSSAAGPGPGPGSGSTGSGGDGGAGGADGANGGDGGCGCRSASSEDGSAIALLALALLSIRRRRAAA